MKQSKQVLVQTTEEQVFKKLKLLSSQKDNFVKFYK